MKKKDVVYLGIDVSKGYADFCLLDSKKQLMDEIFQLDDNIQGHELLSNYLEDQTKTTVKVICALESTGGYEQNWLQLIRRLEKKAPIEVYKLNPRGVKHQIESNLKRTITDGVSSRGIAEYLANNYADYRDVWNKNPLQKEGIDPNQHYCNLIKGMIKQQTARYNQMDKLIYQNFPELLIYCKNGIPNWMIRLLIAYPGASAVRRAQIRGLTSIKGISSVKAENIKQRAKQSISESSHAMEETMIRILAQDINYHKKRIDQLKDILIDSMKSREIELIKSIGGIADWTATVIFLFLGDITRFEGTNQLACFYGVHPRFKQSGDGKWGVRMSKQGSAAMRAILFIAANNAVLHEEYFRKLYHKHRSKGKKHRVVIGIIMHKLLRVIYGILKNKKPFDPKVDESNQKNPASELIKNISKKTRRYHELNTDAPISRSNYKKRRADLECQISTVDINTASSQSTLRQK